LPFRGPEHLVPFLQRNQTESQLKLAAAEPGGRTFNQHEGESMASTAPVVVHFKEVPNSKKVRESIELRCDQISEEFVEVTRFEISLEQDGASIAAHGHVTGKKTDVATQATGKNLRAAADQVLDKVERQLRRIHDKRIFSQRREAQRRPPKRVTPSE
jgi:ribosome-associated translation inhibitor RaiA